MQVSFWHALPQELWWVTENRAVWKKAGRVAGKNKFADGNKHSRWIWMQQKEKD